MADETSTEEKPVPRTAKATEAGKGLNRYARQSEVTQALKAFCENPANFTETGPRTLYDLASTIGFGYATVSRNLQLMKAKMGDPAAPEEEKFNSGVRIWHHRNGIWIWCKQS